MTKINLIVTGTEVKAKVNGPLTGGMVGVRVFIKYDKSWDGLTKTLVCRSSVDNLRCNEVRTVLDVGTETTVAHEVMIAGRTLFLGIEGRNLDGTEVYPTIWADCGRIQPGANADADPTVKATPEVWEQLMLQMGSLAKLNTDHKENLVAAINEAMTKGNGLPGVDGRGITSVTGNTDGSWIFTYDDGLEETVSNEAFMAITEQLNQLFLNVADKEQLAPEFANSIEECTNTSKLYVLPDGYFWAYLLVEHDRPAITVEAGEGGYWCFDEANGMFKWIDLDGWYSKRTNKIPVTPGDQLSYRGVMYYSPNRSYLWLDAEHIVINSGTLSAENEPVVLTAPEGAAYLQCTSFANGKEATLEVLWVRCQAATPSYEWSNTGHAFVPADYEDRIVELEENTEALKKQASGYNDPLYGKKIVYDGDSICYGAGHTGGYAKIIAELTGGNYVNQAVGGGRLVMKGSNSWHSVVDNLPNLPTDGDIYCFEGGINDYWTSGMQLGSFDHSNFDGELDTTTVCGALETIFRYALNNFVGKPVCFVIVHKIQETAYKANASGNTFEEYHDAMVGICQKYSVPYYDAFIESGLNGWNDVHNETFFTDGDGCHPNEEGYKRFYVPQLLDLFRRVVPKSGTESILYFDAIKKYLNDNLTTETWTFELADGSTVTKQVVMV